MLFKDVALLFCMYVGQVCLGDAVKIGDVYIEGKHFTHARTPLLQQNGLNGPKQELNLQVDSVLFSYFYFNNRIHSQTDERQFRVVGWNFKLGISIWRNLDVEYEHFSRHLLDRNPAFDFPVQDSIGFRLYFNRQDDPQHYPFVGGRRR